MNNLDIIVFWYLVVVLTTTLLMRTAEFFKSKSAKGVRLIVTSFLVVDIPMVYVLIQWSNTLF